MSASCTDSTGLRTYGTRFAGIIRRAVPRTVPRPQRLEPAIALPCVALLRHGIRTHGWTRRRGPPTCLQTVTARSVRHVSRVAGVDAPRRVRGGDSRFHLRATVRQPGRPRFQERKCVTHCRHRLRSAPYVPVGRPRPRVCRGCLTMVQVKCMLGEHREDAACRLPRAAPLCCLTCPYQTSAC
jgi:hypothetical protein